MPGVTYEGVSNPVAVTVTVTDANGKLEATADQSNANILFENTYSASPAQIHFRGVKTLVGAELTDGAFSFALYQTDRSFDITKSNAQLLATDENKNGAFGLSHTLSTTGTHFFVIVEDATAPVENIVYDRYVYRFSVQVTDVGDGELRASVTNVNTGVTASTGTSVETDVTFTNAVFEEVTEKEVYQAGNVTTQIDGQQVQEGDILTYFITYTNYTGADVVADIMDVIPNHTSYVEGSASHGGTYAGSHLNWILNVPKSGTVTVCFDVKVDETNVIVANTAVVRDGINTYYTNEVVNHTVEDKAKKDVFAPAEPTVSIDGKNIYAGETLLYKISYKNTATEKATVTITDTVPEHTTYVDGSADNGGVYKDGTITWTVDVEAGAELTVTFKVTVNKVSATIKNKAVVVEGKNIYTTNEVSNTTAIPVVPPTPQTGDNTQFHLWIAIMFISAGGILTTSLCGRKKKEAEEQ